MRRLILMNGAERDFDSIGFVSEENWGVHVKRLRRIIMALSLAGFSAYLGSRYFHGYWLARAILGNLAGVCFFSASLLVVFRVHRAPRVASWVMLISCALGVLSEILKLGEDLIPVYGKILNSLGNVSLNMAVAGWVTFMNPALFEMAVGRFQLLRETEALKISQKGRRRSEKRYQALFESAGEAIVILAPKTGELVEFNGSFCSLCGFDREDMAKQSMASVLETVDPEVKEGIAKAQDGEIIRLYNVGIVRRDGTRARIDLTFSLLPEDEVLVVIRDMTQQKQVEAHLHQLHQIESVGRLAGGIAHDFNNSLTPILGFTELLLDSTPEDNPAHADLEEIHKSAEHARKLTLQLLAVGRQQKLTLQTVNMADVLNGFQNVIRRTIRENIDISIRCAPQTRCVRVDVNQIKQILMNLCVNAQDAMPAGGKLTIETMEVHSDELPAGQETDTCIMLAVTDTGTGMSEETLSNAFEPFFTTREDGNGLGLATVYGIVKQHGGHAGIHSELGMGTTVEIFLPCVDGEPEEEPVSAHPTQNIIGKATILVVEDDNSVRELVGSALRRMGHDILQTRSAEECLALAARLQNPVDLLLTDVIMTGIDGKELHELLDQRWPGLRVVFMSGYPDVVLSKHGIAEKEPNFLQKPISIAELRETVKRVLET